MNVSIFLYVILFEYPQCTIAISNIARQYDMSVVPFYDTNMIAPSIRKW